MYKLSNINAQRVLSRGKKTLFLEKFDVDWNRERCE